MPANLVSSAVVTFNRTIVELKLVIGIGREMVLASF